MGKKKDEISATKEKEQPLSLEESFAKIEEVIERLEAEDITLEESFAAYRQGMALLSHCNAAIDQVEKKVLKINEDGGLDEF